MRRFTAAKCLIGLLLVLTLDMTVTEFAKLQSLSDPARRAQLGMAASCTPGLTAMKRGTAVSERLVVLVDCKSGGRVERPSTWFGSKSR
jgi:hypothetical protein